jgi:hypothetical protein
MSRFKSAPDISPELPSIYTPTNVTFSPSSSTNHPWNGRAERARITESRHSFCALRRHDDRVKSLYRSCTVEMPAAVFAASWRAAAGSRSVPRGRAVEVLQQGCDGWFGPASSSMFSQFWDVCPLPLIRALLAGKALIASRNACRKRAKRMTQHLPRIKNNSLRSGPAGMVRNRTSKTRSSRPAVASA